MFHEVVQITANDQGVRRVREVQDILQVEPQCVGPAAADVDPLDPGHSVIRYFKKIKTDSAAVKAQGVRTAAARQTRKGRVVDGQYVVALAAAQHVAATGAYQTGRCLGHQ